MSLQDDYDKEAIGVSIAVLIIPVVAIIINLLIFQEGPVTSTTSMIVALYVGISSGYIKTRNHNWEDFLVDYTPLCVAKSVEDIDFQFYFFLVIISLGSMITLIIGAIILVDPNSQQAQPQALTNMDIKDISRLISSFGVILGISGYTTYQSIIASRLLAKVFRKKRQLDQLKDLA